MKPDFFQLERRINLGLKRELFMWALVFIGFMNSGSQSLFPDSLRDTFEAGRENLAYLMITFVERLYFNKNS